MSGREPGWYWGRAAAGLDWRPFHWMRVGHALNHQFIWDGVYPYEIGPRILPPGDPDDATAAQIIAAIVQWISQSPHAWNARYSLSYNQAFALCRALASPEKVTAPNDLREQAKQPVDVFAGCPFADFVDRAEMAFAASSAKANEDWRLSFNYLGHLLNTICPSIELLPTLSGRCTQIDNYIVGLRAEAKVEGWEDVKPLCLSLQSALVLAEEIIDLKGREGITDADFAEQVIALAQDTLPTIRDALDALAANRPAPTGREG